MRDGSSSLIPVPGRLCTGKNSRVSLASTQPLAFSSMASWIRWSSAGMQVASLHCSTSSRPVAVDFRLRSACSSELLLRAVKAANHAAGSLGHVFGPNLPERSQANRTRSSRGLSHLEPQGHTFHLPPRHVAQNVIIALGTVALPCIALKGSGQLNFQPGV